MLGQVQYVPPAATQRGAELMERLASLEMPSQAEYVNSLSTMNLGLAIVLLAGGIIYLLNGWKTFKILVIVNAAIVGGLLGIQFGRLLGSENMPLFGGVAGTLLFAVLSWPMMKFAVALMGGLAGSFLGYGMWNYVATATRQEAITQYAWAGALIGLITLGLLAFLVFKLVIMVFTSLQGSLMAVSGLLALLMLVETFRVRLEPTLRSNTHLLVLLLGVPAVIGFAFQYTAMYKKTKKKRKAMEGDS
ncbi:MAG: hypothetical protein ACYSTL_01205 [Planctomycetota bacterium]|jgi:hypothetical protein